VYVERVSANGQMMRVVQAVGTRAPLHATSVGKVFLAADGVEAAQAYAQRVGLARLTDHTLTDPDILARELEEVRIAGHAIDREEAEKGVSCIAAGIRDAEGQLVAGLSVSAPSDRLDEAWAVRIRNAAEHISRAMGCRPRS
jgi:DNA-binding IclR family transcriptional regulator